MAQVERAAHIRVAREATAHLSHLATTRWDLSATTCRGTGVLAHVVGRYP